MYNLQLNRLYKDRVDAGQKLAYALKKYESLEDACVVALPRGGVVVGYEVAKILHLPLDIVSPRKIGAPGNPEFAIGAVTETGDGILSHDVIRDFNISDAYIKATIEEEKKKAKHRLDLYRKGMTERKLRDLYVIIVDDGLATGLTMLAAIRTVRAEKAKKIIVAVPVAPVDALVKIEREIDEVVCLATPSHFSAVGQFYDNFDQVEDEQVIYLLSKFFK